MSGTTRRELLCGAAGLAGLAGLTGLTGRGGSLGRPARTGSTGSLRGGPAPAAQPHRGLRRPDSLPFPDLPPGTDTLPQVDQVVIVMMENHSYDNLLGMLGRGPGQRPRGDGFRLGRDGRPTASNPYPDGRIQHAFHMPTTCQLRAQPSQEWVASHQQYAGGRLDGFVASASGPVAMGYWTGADLPFTYALATTFPVGDRWFSSALAQTYPNRRFLLAATAAGMCDDVTAQAALPSPNGTIVERLEAFGVSWTDYYTSLPTVLLYPDSAALAATHLAKTSRFFTDAAAGRLPGVCLVEPDFTTESQENPQNIVLGEQFLARVVTAVLHSPAWERTLLVLTYDEHGGYYDHVPPPVAPAPDAIPPMPPPGEPSYDGYRRYGFRVPAVVVSPYARPDHVTSVVHDHTSILAMIERKWNLPAMTWRDANAADLTDFLDLRHMAFREPPRLPAPAGSPAALACSHSGPGQIPPPGSVSPPPGR